MRAIGLFCLLATGMFAANGGAPAGHGFGGGHWGGVAGTYHPGFGHAPGRISNWGFGNFGYGPGRYGYGYGNQYGYGLSGYGGLYGFFGDYEPLGGYAYNQPASPPAPSVVIFPAAAPATQTPFVAETAHPVMHDYTQQTEAANTGTATAASVPAETGNPVVYLVAFRDGNIRAAMTYWVDKSTLHYLDTAHKEKQAPLSTVDRDLSAQLNRERHVPFNLQ